MNKQVGNVQLMQKMNRLKVLNYIRRNPSVARPMVAEATGLSLSSITNIVTYLIEKNIVTETGLEAVGRVGRKGILLQFNSLAYRLVCVRLDPTYGNWDKIITIITREYWSKLYKSRENTLRVLISR